MSTEEPKAKSKAKKPQSAEQSKQELAEYHSLECEALLAKYRHVERLLGRGQQVGPEGQYTEYLLREYLRSTIPACYSVDTGFIKGPGKSASGDYTQASPQIDIIIHDSHAYSPILRFDDFVIVLPEAVKAIIEVKKTMTAQLLKDTLVHLEECTNHLSIYAVGPERGNVFIGAFAFSQGIKNPNGRISKSYRNPLHKQCSADLSYTDAAPCYIVEGDGLAIKIHKKRVEYAPVHHGEDKLRLNFGLQIFLYNLMASLNLPEALSSDQSRFSFAKGLNWVPLP